MSLAASIYNLAASPAHAVTFIVDRDYTVEAATHYRTIQHAADAVATNGTVVKVAKGTYDQTLLVDKPVQLLGSGANVTLLNTSSERQPGLIVIAPMSLSAGSRCGGADNLVAGIVVGGDFWATPTIITSVAWWRRSAPLKRAPLGFWSGARPAPGS